MRNEMNDRLTYRNLVGSGGQFLKQTLIRSNPEIIFGDLLAR